MIIHFFNESFLFNHEQALCIKQHIANLHKISSYATQINR